VLGNVDLLAGFHPVERDLTGPFAWTTSRFLIGLRCAARFARLTLCYYGDDGLLTAESARGLVDQTPLCRGWHACGLRLGDTAAGDVIACSVAPVVPVATDARELGIMVREIVSFNDEEAFESLAAAHRNLRLNQDEYRLGRTVLASFPPALRINLEARCNIPETSQACAYCAWDWAKEAERGSPAITLDTLDDLGDYYRRALEINDCSIGEPAMHKQFGAIVAAVDCDGKQLALTTNGQLLSPKLRSEVLGKRVSLYVSIDSATAEGYARYRNDRFNDVVANLRALCREKKAHDDLPRVYVSFIVMRSNATELPQFFALASEIGVDEVKLRSLYLDDNVAPLTSNNGYRYDYAAELLATSELAAAAEAARKLAREHGVALYVEWEQFVGDAGRPGAPLCSEPWRTLYVLRRGIMPCSYATEPIARWNQRRGRPLAAFLQDVFNGPAYREIRGELAAGRLSEYCRNTPSCPILKDLQKQGRLAAPQNTYQRQALAERPEADQPLPIVPLETLIAAGRAA
jgi:MoaA/NifB/PqqE/SkfB family radical SAM enzyme